jgi:hypothetical protein
LREHPELLADLDLKIREIHDLKFPLSPVDAPPGE